MTMKPHMSTTVALALARRAVGNPIRQSSTSYVIYCPYRSYEPNGASTEIRRSSYPRIARERATQVAEVAIYAMYHGILDDQDIFEALFLDPDRNGSAEERLQAALAYIQKRISTRN
jgi:hypothetical protein